MRADLKYLNGVVPSAGGPPFGSFVIKTQTCEGSHIPNKSTDENTRRLREKIREINANEQRGERVLTYVEEAACTPPRLAGFYKMKILIGLTVLVLLLAIEAAALNGERVSPSLTYWHEKLPTTAMPETLKVLISAEDEKVAVNVGKGGVNVNVGKGNTPPKAPAPAPKGKGKGVGVAVKPPVKGGGGGGVSVRTPGKGVGVHVGTQSPYDYNYAADTQMLADPSLSMFLLEKDLHSGTKVSLRLVQENNPDAQKTQFLPRGVAEQIPFTSDKFSVALKELNVEQDSDMGVAMKETLQECESPAIKGESKYCATSLESMIDYSTSRLGSNHVTVLATNVPKTAKSMKQEYTIVGVKYVSKPGEKSVGTRTARVWVKGEDGSRAEAVAVCHADTSAWNPNHVAFQVLNVKPGAASLCHFIPQDHVVWLPVN
ncbi:hypothetical protein SUGI_1180290 [Cryptomeria japonica]|nr:hypothetical protein SUGI_1180290 [Cryptomeria japonica]